MDVRRFLTSVVAWDSGGYVTVHWYHRKDRRWFGRSHHTIDDVFVTIADLNNAEEIDVYFCLSTQRSNAGSRSRENAKALRAVWVDLDIDPINPKKYATLEEALRALLNFCRLIEIPIPSFIVFSGGGIHGYWASDRDLTVEEWQPYADVLKAAARASTLRIDAGVTSDAARILRFPTTKNWKYGEPRPVTLAPASNGKQHNFAEVFKKIFADFPRSEIRHSDKKLEIASLFGRLDPNKTLAGNLEFGQAEPVSFDAVKAECGWLRHVHDTGGIDQDEPLWKLALNACIFLENGEKLIHELGDKHSGYTPESTETKFARARDDKIAKDLGWPLCRTIHDAGADQCQICPHRDRGRSPIGIGWERTKAFRDAEEMKKLGGKRPPGLRLPEGFCEDGKDRIAAFIPTQGGDTKGSKVTPGHLLWLISNKLHTPSLQKLDGHLGINFFAAAHREGNDIKDVEVFLTLPDTARGNLFKMLLAKGVNYNRSNEAMQMAELFAASWLDKLRIEDTPTIRDTGMSWRWEQGEILGFVYGNILYHENGTMVPLLVSEDEFRSWYMPVGSRDAWIKAAKLLTDRKRPELDILIAVAFAAPLTVFAGTLYGPILVEWGPPGTSKSTGQMVAAAVWGHPKQTRESLTSTTKSVLNRLGRTRNLPAWWDDVQDDRHHQQLFDCVFVAAEGAEGGRLNPDASYKQRLQWQTIMVACANASFVEYLTRKQKSTTAGMRRVFEIEFDKQENEPGMINATDAMVTFAALERNYGMIGAEYAAILGREHQKIRVFVEDTIKQFTEKVSGIGDESFWTGLCGVLIAGATLARRLGVELDVEMMEIFLVKTFLENRRTRVAEGTEAGTYEHTERAITGFLNHFYGSGHAQTVNKLFTHPTIKIQELQAPAANNPILIQIARDQRLFVVSRRALRGYLDDNDIRSRQVFAGLVKWFKAKEGKLTLGAGTSRAQAQELCFIFRAPEGKSEVLDGMLTACGEPKSWA